MSTKSPKIKAVLQHFTYWSKANGYSSWYHIITNTVTGEQLELVTPHSSNMYSALRHLKALEDQSGCILESTVDISYSDYRTKIKDVEYHDCCRGNAPQSLIDLFSNESQ